MNHPRALFIGLCASLAATTALAHDFWIAASPPRCQPGQTVTITANVGDDSYPISQSVTAPDRIESVRLVGPATTMVAPHFRTQGQSLAADLQLPKAPATYMVALAVKGRFISMQPKEFADYLKEEGLASVQAERERRGETGRPSRERFSRQAKTLIHAGEGSSDHITRPVGMAAEIVPETDLTTAHAGDDVGFRLLLEGKPVAGAQVSVYSAGSGDLKSRRQVVRTTDDGRGHVMLKGTGPYLLTTTLMVRREGETGPEAVDWESYWVSLTFAASPQGAT